MLHDAVMWTVLIIFLFIGLNAILAGIEIAFVSVNKSLVRSRARQEDNDAKKLLKLKKNPEKVLSAIQVGITLLGALSAAIGGAAAGLNIVPYLQNSFSLQLITAEIIAILFVVIPITYATVVLGEITPKSLAIQNPYYFAIKGIPVLKFLTIVFYPAVKLCEISTMAILRLIPKQKSEIELEYRENEQLLTGYYTLPREGKKYMVNLAKMQEKKIQDILLPWNYVVYVSYDQNFDELEKKIISFGHTRMPVVKNDKVIGVINTKELLALTIRQNSNWHKMIHKPVIVKKDDSPLKTLNRLRKEWKHMGIVENDSEEPIGIVTIEDIIEEFLGEIYDEDDRGQQTILKR